MGTRGGLGAPSVGVAAELGLGWRGESLQESIHGEVRGGVGADEGLRGEM